MCFGSYEGSLRGLIHLFKYSGIKPLAAPLGRLLDRVLPLEESFDAVVPVPLHWRKRWERGFNQAGELAAHVAARRATPLVHALKRRRATATQAGLASAGRRKNVAGAFAITQGAELKDKKILLIDDVMTTGATARACAAALKRGGAKSVSLLTLARVDRRWRP